MKHLDNIQDAALDALNNDSPAEADETQDVESSSTDDQPAPEAVDLEARGRTQDSTEETKTPSEAQATADLSKFQKVTIDGREMSLDDLKKSLMRQDDYTRKTQELAREKKYSSNLQADLQTVRGNPALAAEFKRIYPKQYHSYLDLVMSQDAAQARQQGKATPELPPEITQRLQKVDEIERYYVENQAKAIDAQLQNAEANLAKKYPQADPVYAYSMAQEAKNQWEQQSGQKMPADALNEKFLEPFFKKSAEYQEALFNRWQKEKANKARSTNAAASDTGKGGGTPGAPPTKLKLKDVSDYILGSGEL